MSEKLIRNLKVSIIQSLNLESVIRIMNNNQIKVKL